ncbi:MAG: 4Fe-4S dicluster domain-containing protein, partial [Desulfobacteraceae bacterium]|nr:4Fe-4S dicluster domain-containing protein [Desulfobacteraceae bacterium]
MDIKIIDKALASYEKTLRSQERFRRVLGVREVNRPTYERYIIGDIERFDRKRTAFLCLMQRDNPYGEEYRKTFKRQTGHDSFVGHLPQRDLEPADRIGSSMAAAAVRLCTEYNPKTLPVTPFDGRVPVDSMSQMSRLVKKVALLFGAEMVRITRVDQRWVYKDVDIPHKYAIIIAVSHKRGLNATAPSHLSGVGVSDTYSRLKFITTQLADFICGLGYDAMYRETRGPLMEMNLVPMAIDAGIGEFSRNGRVLSPEFGINMRLKAVTTDLPLKIDKPISFGVHEFCTACENCATFCPANAIPHGPPTDEPPTIHNNKGFRKWFIRADRCLTFWSVNKKKWVTCGGRCIVVCP